MADFPANINLKVNSTAAERQIRKVERNLTKVENTSKDILNVDKRIVVERRKLLGLTKDAAALQRQKLKFLGLEKTELSLQRKELLQINRLEKQRIANSNRARGTSAAASSGGGGVGGVGAFAGGLVAAKALSPKQLITKSKALKGLEEFRDRQSDALDAVVEDLDEATKKYQQKLDRFNEVRAKRPLLTSKGTFQPTTRTSRNSFFSAREGLFDARGQVASQTKLVKGLDNQIGDLSKELDASAKASNKARGAFSGLGKALAAVGIAIGTVEIARFIGNSFKTTAAIESQRIRLKALSTGFDDYQAVLQAVDRGQALFNQTQRESAEGFGTAYSRLRPLGLTLEQVQAVYEGFNVAALNSGTTAAEASGAFTQLTQALGAGALRGDELRSILEQTPAIAQAIAKELKITVGQLKDFGKDGKISSEAVLKALVAVRNEGVNKLSESLNTPVQKFKKLEIAGENFKIAIADEALPAVTEAVGNLAEIITALEGPIRFIGRLANQTLSGITDLINAATKPGEVAAAASIRGGRLPFNVQATSDLFEGTGPQGKGLKGLQEQATELARLRNQPRNDVLLQLMQDRLEAIEKVKRAAIEPITISTDLSGVFGDKPTTEEDPKLKTVKELLGTDWDKAVGLKESQAQLKLTEMQSEALLKGDTILFDKIEKQREYVRTLIEIDALNEAITKSEARLVEFMGDEELLGKANNKIEELKNQLLIRQVDLRNQLSTAGNITLKDDLEAAEAFGKLVQNLEPLERALTPIEETLNNIGGTITNGLVDGLALAVTETDRLGEAFQNLAADILEAIGKQLILSAITTGISALGGNDGVGLFSMLSRGLGKREAGGPISAGTPYIVGEKGPELVVPNSSGMVLNNRETQNVMSRYSPATGGGNGGGNVNVSYTVERINEVNYVTESTFQAGMKQAAKEGAAGGNAKTMNTLRNSRSQRNRIGMR